DAIAAWQKAKNLPATGFIDAGQQQALLREGAEAIRSFDREQQKADEERKRSEEARAKAGDEKTKQTDPVPQGTAAPSAPQAAAAPNKALRPDAGSRWVDNWGATYWVIVTGDRYSFTAS